MNNKIKSASNKVVMLFSHFPNNNNIYKHLFNFQFFKEQNINNY